MEETVLVLRVCDSIIGIPSSFISIQKVSCFVFHDGYHKGAAALPLLPCPII